MKFYLSLFFIFILSLTSVFAYECQDNMEWWNSPCEVITPVLTSACGATVLNINDTDLNYSSGMSAVGDGTYNFTFNYTDVATYSITLDCDDWATSINLNTGSEEQEPGFNLWIIMFVIFFILLVVGIFKHNYLFLFFAGGLSMLMGVYIFQGGITIYGVEEWWIYPLAWIFIGIGLILSLVSGLKFIAQAEGDDDYENYDDDY